MSAGVSDQRMKSQGNPGNNVCKEQIEGGEGVSGEGLVEWRHPQHQTPSYAAPISSPPDPYAQGYYGTAGTAFQYQSFGVGDGTWSTNGTDPMTFLGGYAQHDSYAMDGVFGPSTTAFSTATFGQPTSAVAFNYFNTNGDYSTWGGQIGARNKPYDDYYRQDGLYMPDGLKAVEAGVQGLSLADGNNKLDKELLKDGKDSGGGNAGGGAPKKTWATIASQPAKPQPSTQSTGLKKKGPGMPPPPIIPGKHNMDIGTWDSGSSSSSNAANKPVPSGINAGANCNPNNNGPPAAMQSQPPQQQPMGPPQSPMSQPPPPMAPHQPPMPQQKSPQQQHQMPMQQQMHMQQQMVLPPQQSGMQGRPTWGPPQRAPMPRPPPPQPLLMQGPTQAPPQMPPPQMPQSPQQVIPHPVLDELKIKNNYNPPEFDLTAPNARFFVIKSYSEDDIHRSIKYEIWCSTEHGNKRLDNAFREREKEGGVVYLFFSVNGSGHFCGMAQMVSAVDYNSNSSVWSQDKWKGQFKVHWIYVKDVPNLQLRHIRLENNENKPVTNSRDTQEVPHAKGLQVLRMIHGYKHSTSIFDDFIHYEKRQEEEDQRKVPEVVYKENHHQGNYEGKSHHHGGYEKHDSYGKGNYNRDYNREHGGYKDHGGYNKDHGYGKDHGGYNKGHGGGYKDHGGYNKEHGYNKDGGYEKDHGNGGDNYGGGGGYKGHRGGDREHGGYRDHRDGQGQGGGYRPHHQMHKDRGDGSRGGRGRNRPNN